MSRSVSLYSTSAALKAADTILGEGREWIAETDVQVNWLADVYKPCRGALAEGIPEIVSNATFDINNHVAFMEKFGETPQVTELGPDEFVTAGNMDVKVEWLEEGEVVADWGKPQYLEDVPMAKVEEGVTVFKRDGHSNPIACIDTKSGDKVYLTRIDTEADGTDLVKLAAQLFATEGRERTYYQGVVYPMVGLAQKRDLDYLVGMHTTSETGQRCTLVKAVQQITFKMNHKGARARAADEMVMTLECAGPTPLLIDGNFLVAIVRPGLPLPLFTSFVTREDWKDPGEL